jgi:hypothetical protein
MKVLVACEFSGIVRDAFRSKGHDAWSCDLLECEGDFNYHIQGDVLNFLSKHASYFDLMIAHPPCTRLTYSGVRWLHIPPKGRTLESMWLELEEAAKFYVALRNANVPKKAIENPVMHKHAKKLIGTTINLTKCSWWFGNRYVVQPWWFGDELFKATGFELYNLPKLIPTNKLNPPKSGIREYKEWSAIHRMAPGPERWKNRSRTSLGIANAMAEQWGE